MAISYKSAMAKHVAVIGSGIIGSALAFSLAEQGARVSLVDSGEGGGLATRASFAWINANWGNAPDYFRFRRFSMGEWRKLAAKIGGLPLKWTGAVFWDLPAAELDAFFHGHSKLGYRLSWLQAKDIAKREPHLKAVPEKALLAEEEGVAEPLQAVQVLRAAAQSKGAVFLPHQHVKALTTKNGRVTGVRTEDREIEADDVVLAAGAGSVPLAQTAGVALPLTTPGGLLVHSKPAARIVNGLLISPQLHVRQTSGGQVVAGSDFGGSQPGKDPDGTAQRLFEHLQSFLTGGERLALAYHTLGYRPTPKDGLPVIGRPPGLEGLYVAVMHSGITNAAGTGLLAAREILSGARDPLLAPFSAGRFQDAHA
jgi:glycine/D-amino acid oxidase-like deaminating enzyme